MTPKYLKQNNPNVIVKIELSVEIKTMLPASFAFPFIDDAIIKLAIAVGHENIINKIPKSSFITFNINPINITSKGETIFFINVDPNAKPEASFIDFVLIEAPIPVNASGREISAK